MIQQAVLIVLSNHPFIVGVKAIFTANHFPLNFFPLVIIILNVRWWSWARLYSSEAVESFLDIGVGVRKFLGVRRIFARISPNLPERFMCDFGLQIFSHKDHKNLFYVTSKTKIFYVFFCKRGAPFFPWFSEILPKFLTNQYFLGVRLHPASYTTLS